MAEREGFEPPVPLRVRLISSQVHSTGLCHLSAFGLNDVAIWDGASGNRVLELRCGGRNAGPFTRISYCVSKVEATAAERDRRCWRRRVGISGRGVRVRLMANCVMELGPILNRIGPFGIRYERFDM
jgi:hypothetical protein